MSEKKNTVIKQASFLMAATLICRVIGLLYRSPLHGIMGDVGDGYYSFAYEWYNMILLIASYSIPMAVSKVMAELLAVRQFKNAQKVFHAALLYVTVVGLIGAAAAYFGAPFFLAKQPDAVLALRVMAPTIFLSGFLGVLRGYFQAQNTMMPTAVSQIGEQIVNAVISVAAAWFMTRPYAADANLTGKFGAAGGTIGTGAGVVTGLLIMAGIYFLNRRFILKRLGRDRTGEFKTLTDCLKLILLMVTPVLLATCVYNLSGIVDQTLFTWLMPLKGFTAEQISTQYALFGYQFRPIINIPIALASATSTALIPAVAASIASKDTQAAEGKITSTVSFTMFLAIPSAVGIAVLSLPIIRILYPGANQNAAAVLLSLGAVSVIFYCLSTVTNGVLQGLGKPSLPVCHAAAALAVNAVVLTVGVALFNMGIAAVMLATILYAMTVSFLNALSLKKIIPYKTDIRRAYLEPLAAAAVMGVVVGALYWGMAALLPSLIGRYLFNALWTVFVVLAGMLTYAVAYVLISRKNADELKRMPMGTRILQVFRLLHIPVRETAVDGKPDNKKAGKGR